MAVDQLLSRVPFSVTPWTAAGSPILHCLPEFAQIMSIEPISSSAASFSFCLQSCPHQSLFQWVGSSHHVAKILELQLQHPSFQWIFRVDFLWDWLAWSLCSPRDSQESSPAPQSKSINSLVLSNAFCKLWSYFCFRLISHNSYTICGFLK